MVKEEKKKAEITTVEQLEVAYPELVGQVREEAAAAVAGARPADLNIPGFLLERDDPFAAGVARAWAKLKKISVPGLPIVLPFNDRNTAAALNNYILRAAGGGDSSRVKAAKEARVKVKG